MGRLGFMDDLKLEVVNTSHHVILMSSRRVISSEGGGGRERIMLRVI